MLCPVRALGYKGFPTNRKRQQVETNSSQPHIRAAANLPLNVCSFTNFIVDYGQKYIVKIFAIKVSTKLNETYVLPVKLL